MLHLSPFHPLDCDLRGSAKHLNRGKPPSKRMFGKRGRNLSLRSFGLRWRKSQTHSHARAPAAFHPAPPPPTKTTFVLHKWGLASSSSGGWVLGERAKNRHISCRSPSTIWGRSCIKKDVNESSNLISNSRGNPGFAFTTGSYRAERIRERIAHEPRSRTSRREESCLLPKEG